MLKDDIATIDELVNDSDDFRCGYGFAWERIKTALESQNTSTNKPSAKCYSVECPAIWFDKCTSVKYDKCAVRELE